MNMCVWKEREIEEELLADVSIEEPWALLETFNQLVRNSGSGEERQAVEYLTGRLAEWGVEYKVYEPELFISLPQKASVAILAPETRQLAAKTPSFSVSTPAGGVEGEVVYFPTGHARGIDEIFSSQGPATAEIVADKIVLTEGFPMPGKVWDFMAAGARGIVFISPGERIHEGICTSIWGAPDLDTIHRKPSLPVVSIAKSAGEWLKGLAAAGPVTVNIKTQLDEGWRKCPVVVAEFTGSIEPERFVLLHGHIDSWHVGISDNATGNAAMLEVARVLARHRDKLKRSIRLAWWSGHSHGRYAGSTWYADNFALDLLENCLAHVNCDSPGTRDATAYRDVMWMQEFDDFCRLAIEDAIGVKPTGGRLIRAGDCSFSNLGVNSFYMLLSSIPEEVKAAKGLYAVGGSGGNNEWHHEDDTIEVVDPEVLLKDIKIYLLSVVRLANSPVLPYNYGRTVAEILEEINNYQRAAQGKFDFSPLQQEAQALLAETQKLGQYQQKLQGQALDSTEVQEVNGVLLELSRLLTPLNFTRGERFRHDPALENPPLPDLAPASLIGQAEEGSDQYYLLRSHLQRSANKVLWTLRQARLLIQSLQLN